MYWVFLQLMNSMKVIYSKNKLILGFINIGLGNTIMIHFEKSINYEASYFLFSEVKF